MTDTPGDLPDQVEAASAAASEPEAAPAAPEPTPAEQAAALRAQAAAIEASVPVRQGFTRMKVGPPHDGFMYGGHWIGSEFTDVNELLVPGLTQAADEAGVTLIEEGA